MKKRVYNKLRSRTGASITFALLIFLVCSVLCVAIIAAATAASGRMSAMAEMDQRYYSVTSATNLMKDLLDGKTISVVKRTVIEEAVTYPSGEVKPNSTTTTVTTYLIPDKNASTLTETDLADDAKIDSIEKNSIPIDAAVMFSANDTDKKRTLNLASGMEKDPLAATVKEEMDADGNITMLVYNTDGDSFKQEMLFSVHKITNSYSNSTDSVQEVTNNASYTVLRTTTKTEITSLTWTLASVRTLEAPLVQTGGEP